MEEKKNSSPLATLLLVFAFFIVAPHSAHALIASGESAVDILGQFTSPSSDVTADYVKGCINNGASSIGFNIPSGVAIDATNHLIFMTDTSNNRVLVFTLTGGNVISSKTPANVLGQPDFISCGAALTQSGMSAPSGLAVDPVHQLLFVSDSTNNRVLVFSTASISNGMNASNELGQVDFTHATVVHDQHAVTGPTGLFYDSANRLLYVADTTNNRVMIFSTASISNNELAANELGQPSGTAFSSNSAATTQSGMSAPKGVALDSANSVLYVADGGNNRITTYTTSGLTNGENALNELGQATGGGTDFTTKVQTSSSQAGLSNPESLAYDSANTRLFVFDTNNRVMIFSTSGLTNGENAANVLGQSVFTANASALTQAGLNSTHPNGLAYDATNSQLYVSDGTNNRMMLFSTSSITNGENASDALGQYTSLTSTATVTYSKNGNNNGVTALGVNSPYGEAFDNVNHRLFVPDSNNNRVLVYNLNTDNSLPTGSGGHTASNVLGQSDFISSGAATTLSGMSNPRSVAFDPVNNRLFVGDGGNNRILVFNTSSITNGMNASNELCQASGGSAFTTKVAAVTQPGCSGSAYLTLDSINQRLFVGDSANSRIMIFNVAPGTIANGENASYQLGQADFTHNNAVTPAQASLSAPGTPAYDAINNRLFVSDNNNNRIMVFNVAPASIASGENASNELGQATGGGTDYTTKVAATTQAGLNVPRHASYDPNNNRLFVADANNNRVMVFDVSPNKLTNGENASYQLGQPNFVTKGSVITQSGLGVPVGAYYNPANSLLFVDDIFSSRITIYDGSTNSSPAFGYTPGYD